ncbi:hypothetical protein VTN02DRAFT_3899 [Thermoascus thermophilus]
MKIFLRIAVLDLKHPPEERTTTLLGTLPSCLSSSSALQPSFCLSNPGNGKESLDVRRDSSHGASTS